MLESSDSLGLTTGVVSCTGRSRGWTSDMNMCDMQNFFDIGFDSGSAAAHRSLKEAFVAYHGIPVKRAIEMWVLHLCSDYDGLYTPLFAHVVDQLARIISPSLWHLSNLSVNR